jgi:hypothetical protein
MPGAQQQQQQQQTGMSRFPAEINLERETNDVSVPMGFPSTLLNCYEVTEHTWVVRSNPARV